ncbi:MAG: FtsX-like permease family protein [Methanobacteriota archaeon]|nr:MAG: FtsX-like permease family protein [Euryarchaeota archaeon]
MVVLSLARKYVFRRPSQNLAVFLGITLGVSLFVGIQVGSASLGEGFGALQRFSLGERDAIFSPAFTPFFVDNETISYAFAEALGQQADPSTIKDYASLLEANETVKKYVEEISPRLELSFTMVHDESGSIEISELVKGISPDERTFGRLLDKGGNELKLENLAPGEVYMGRGLADIMFPDQEEIIGENITLSTTLFSFSLPSNDSFISSKPVFLNTTVTIAGIFEEEEKGQEALSQFIAVPLDWLQELIHKSYLEAQLAQPLPLQFSEPIIGYGPTPINRLVINWKDDIDEDPEKREIAFNATRDAFKELVGPGFDEFYTYTNSLQLIDEIIEGITESMTLILNIFGALIAIAALLVIVNIQSMALQAREKETGIMRAIGANRRQLILTNLSESLFLGLFGSAAGLIGGAIYGKVLIFLLGYVFDFPANVIPLVITRDIITSSFWAGVIVSQITGLIPAINASRINIAQVLRGLRPPSKPSFGRKSLYFGILASILAVINLLNLKMNPLTEGKDAFIHMEDTTQIYLAVAFLLVGPSLIFAYYRSKKIGLTIASLGLLIWGYFNIFVVFDWIETGNGGLNYMLYIMLSILGGTITLIGMNLDIIAVIGEKIFSAFAGVRKTPIRGTAMVAFRQMKSKKVRSTLTFALFATILTLNIFLATWSNSFRYGFDNLIIETTAGSDIMLLSGQPVPSSANFSQQVLEQFGQGTTTESGLHIEFLKPFTVSKETDALLDADGNRTMTVSLTKISKNSLWDKDGNWVLRFDLEDNKTGTIFEVGDDNPDEPAANAEDHAVWKALVNNQTLPNKDGEPRPIIITGTIAEADIGGFRETHRPGDSVYLNLTDGSVQEFVIGAIVLGNPLVDFLSPPQQGPNFGSLWFVNDFWSERLLAFDGVNRLENAYLGKTDAPEISDKRIEKLATEIEVFANSKDSEFRNKYGLFGIYGFSVFSVYESFLEIQFRFFNFLQAFTSMGFVVGILGLFVVALRSVAERQREIGMLRALGFRRFDVVLAVVIELIVMGLIGLIIGLFNGTVLGYALINIGTDGDAAFIIPWLPILGYIALTLGSAFIAAVFPGYRSSRIPPSDALRYTG